VHASGIMNDSSVPSSKSTLTLRWFVCILVTDLTLPRNLHAGAHPAACRDAPTAARSPAAVFEPPFDRVAGRVLLALPTTRLQRR
jgi:hypothetical protein